MSARLASPAADMLGQYERIAAITDLMVTAAKGNDWRSALAFAQQYCSAVATLRDASNAQTALSAEERAVKHSLLLRILANDAMMRDASMPQLARWGALLSGLKRQQRLHRAYGCAPESLP